MRLVSVSRWPFHGRLTLVLAALVAAPNLWAQSMFRGDPAHTGLYAPADGPEPAGMVKWAFKTGAPVVSSPVLAAGTLFVGSDDGAVYALDPAAGTVKWKFATDSYVRSTPAVSEEVVYFGSYDGNFYAVEQATGQLRWKFATLGERKFAAKGLHGSKPREQIIPDAWDCYASSPTVVDGTVFFGSGDRHIYALDAKTGALRWKFATNDVVHASPAVAGGTVYVGSWDTYLYALNAATGELRWKFQTGADATNHNQEGIQSSPCVVDGVVYFGCRDFHLYAVDAGTGALKWKHKITWINATPTVRGGRVYAATSIPAMFFALDARTGEEIYRVDLKVPAFSSPTLAGNRAYVGSFSGKLFAIDVRAGKVAWEFQTAAAKANVRQALTPSGELNGAVLFPVNFFEKMFTAVDSLFELGAILSSPLVDQGVVYVGSADGNVYALK
jgi:outer membrane protein assembly factor BamB